MVLTHVLTMLPALMKSTDTCAFATTDMKVMEKFAMISMNAQLIQKPVLKTPPVLTKMAVTHVPVMKVMSVMVWCEESKRDAKTSMSARSEVETNVTQVQNAVIPMAHTIANVQKDISVMVSIAKTSMNAMDQISVIQMHSVSIPAWKKTQMVTHASAKMVSLTHMETVVFATT